MSEFHNLAEVALNNKGNSWGNLGYWKDRKDYSDAGRALAMLLGDAIGLDEDSTVIDAGFGCGDQLLLWRQHYNVGDIRGINYSCSQTGLARQKLIDHGHPEDADRLRYGNVGKPENWTFTDLPAANRIIALDCAYHFPSRRKFLELAEQNIARGGRIGLTDFLLSNGQETRLVARWILAVMFKLSRIPAANIVTAKHYVDEMRKAGFNQIEIKDISTDVMPAFANWWRIYGHTADAKALPALSRLKYGATAGFLDWAHRNNILRYCLISGIKSKSAP